MLTNPTFDRLNALGLHGMAKAFVDIEATGEAASLGHAEWLALLLEREVSLRHDKRLATRLRHAKLRQQACVEDVDYRTPRGLDRALFASLVEGRWIDDHANLLICGPAGVGKSWIATALGQKACRDNRSVLYQRVPRLFDDLALARGDGRHPRLLRALGRVDLLILDDSGLAPLDAGARHDLLEILEDRYGRRSTLVTSQLPVDQWHALIGDPTYLRRRRPRSPRPQRPSARSLRRKLAPNPAIRPKGLSPWRCGHAASLGQRQGVAHMPTATAVEEKTDSSRDSRLTMRLDRCQRTNRPERLAPGRDQSGEVGDIVSESPGDFKSVHPGDFVGIRTLLSDTENERAAAISEYRILDEIDGFEGAGRRPGLAPRARYRRSRARGVWTEHGMIKRRTHSWARLLLRQPCEVGAAGGEGVRNPWRRRRLS